MDHPAGVSAASDRGLKRRRLAGRPDFGDGIWADADHHCCVLRVGRLRRSGLRASIRCTAGVRVRRARPWYSDSGGSRWSITDERDNRFNARCERQLHKHVVHDGDARLEPCQQSIHALLHAAGQAAVHELGNVRPSDRAGRAVIRPTSGPTIPLHGSPLLPLSTHVVVRMGGECQLPTKLKYPRIRKSQNRRITASTSP